MLPPKAIASRHPDVALSVIGLLQPPPLLPAKRAELVSLQSRNGEAVALRGWAMAELSAGELRSCVK